MQTRIQLASAEDAGRFDRALGEVFAAQEAALSLVETLEAAGRPVDPALIYLMAAAFDRARAMQRAAGLAGPRLVHTEDRP